MVWLKQSEVLTLQAKTNDTVIRKYCGEMLCFKKFYLTFRLAKEDARPHQKQKLWVENQT